MSSSGVKSNNTVVVSCLGLTSETATLPTVVGTQMSHSDVITEQTENTAVMRRLPLTTACSFDNLFPLLIYGLHARRDHFYSGLIQVED